MGSKRVTSHLKQFCEDRLRNGESKRGEAFVSQGSLRGASPLLKNSSPFPLLRGRGIKGDGVITNQGVR